MNREKTQELIDLREEQRADIFTVVRQDEENFTVNGHAYRLITEHKQGFDADKFGQRFSTVLSKYDYIVGDWGFDQLRLKGFYDEQNPSATKLLLSDNIQDYLYEDCNFGCAYFIVQNLDVQVPKQRHTKRRSSAKKPSRRSRNTSHTTNSSESKKTTPVIKEKKESQNQSVKQRKHQKAVTVNENSRNKKFVIRHK